MRNGIALLVFAPADLWDSGPEFVSSFRVDANTYCDFDRVYLLVPAQDYVGEFVATFKDFPPRQKAASFNVEPVLEKLREGSSR